jgi:hypothetical protein
MHPPLERDLYYVSLRPVSLALRSIGLVLPRRLDLHYFVLIGTLSVFCGFEHYHALSAD